MARRTTGTGKDRRDVGGGSNAIVLRAQYDADGAQKFQEQEEIGTSTYSKKREVYQELLESGKEVDTIFFSGAVTAEDYMNGRGLFVSKDNPTGFVRANVMKKDRCTSTRYIPTRAALCGALALLIVLIQLTVHWKLGSFTTLTSAKDLVDLFVVPTTIQSLSLIHI